MTNTIVIPAPQISFDGIAWSVLDHEVHADPAFALLVRTYQPEMWAWYRQHGAKVIVYYDLQEALSGGSVRIERSRNRAAVLGSRVCRATVRLARIVDGKVDKRCLRGCQLA